MEKNGTLATVLWEVVLVSMLPSTWSPFERLGCRCLWEWFIINSLSPSEEKRTSSPELCASVDTFFILIYQPAPKRYMNIHVSMCSQWQCRSDKKWDQVNRIRSQHWSLVDRLNSFSWKKKKVSWEAGASRNPSTVTSPLSPLTSSSPCVGLLLPKPRASEVWILDSSLVLPCSGLRLRMLPGSSIGVFPKQARAPCAVNRGMEGLTSTQLPSGGLQLSQASLALWVSSSEVWQKMLLGNLSILLILPFF